MNKKIYTFAGSYLKQLSMKTKSLIFVLLLAMGGAFTANAQLTTGEPTAKVIRTGNRAKKGDFGLYIGATNSMFGNLMNDNVEATPLPLINFKYMSSNNLEMRIGLEAYKLSEKLNGDVDKGENTVANQKQKYGESTLMLYPGLAYHFSRLNILDVYVGAELPLGWDTNTMKLTEENYVNNTTKRSFVLGLGAFIGLQAYIADLPLALGLEYGISSRLDTGLKYKNELTVDNQTTVTYSPTGNFSHINSRNDFEKLKARKGEIGSQLRLTLSYYFK
jgi:hypothetical protein